MTDNPILTRADMLALFAKAARDGGFNDAQTALFLGSVAPRARLVNLTGGGVAFQLDALSEADEAELNELLAQAGEDESQ